MVKLKLTVLINQLIVSAVRVGTVIPERKRRRWERRKRRKRRRWERRKRRKRRRRSGRGEEEED
jgi:hypothetical protein